MDPRAEWLETDGIGGYAMGTHGGPRTRRYHALICAALAPPGDRHVLVNGCDVELATGGGRVALSTQAYAGGVLAPDGHARLARFAGEPWPTTTFQLADGRTIVHEFHLVDGAPLAVLSWRLVAAPATPRSRRGRRGDADTTTLSVRPFLTGRDAHALHRENLAFRFDATIVERRRAGAPDTRVSWRPYDALPAVVALANCAYRHEPLWYRNFHYAEDAARGFEAEEDAAAPGTFEFDLAALPDRTAWLVLAADVAATRPFALAKAATTPIAVRLRAAERRRRARFATPLARAASQFVLHRDRRATILAGFPWFADWGRDSFISLRGISLRGIALRGRAPSRDALSTARAVLLTWCDHVSEGMLPNRFDEKSGAAEYNSADAGLWFIVAVARLLERRGGVAARDRKRLLDACGAIVDGCLRGTRHGIRADADGLLAAGAPGQQLTWMDARAYGREVTPRSGKPVEIQALWLHALAFAAAHLPGRAAFTRRLAIGRNAFHSRFWNEERRSLHDVVDVDHVAGTVDPSVRPNQLLAVAGLPLQLVIGTRAKAVVAIVERELVTPKGVRTLAPSDPRYRPRYEGGPEERNLAYHQGTAWPWLLGPFVDAWCRVHGDTAATRRTAAERFVAPLLHELAERGVAHVPEVADGGATGADAAPQRWGGCPAQAWSLAELLRVLPGGQ